MPFDVMVFALSVAFVAGAIKGLVGFAMPLVMLSLLALVTEPLTALAGLILPTVASNILQAFGQGRAAMVATLREFRTFLLAGGVALVLSAQLITVIPTQTVFFLIGVPVFLLTLLQILGLKVAFTRSPRVEGVFGAVAGAVGGVSGVWGPLTVLYLTAIDTEKRAQLRIQGVIYLCGAFLLMASHLGSGVLNRQTLPFSAALVVPALAGMWLGGKMNDRVDQVRFRKITLFVLLIASANLIRRGMM